MQSKVHLVMVVYIYSAIIVTIHLYKCNIYIIGTNETRWLPN